MKFLLLILCFVGFSCAFERSRLVNSNVADRNWKNIASSNFEKRQGGSAVTVFDLGGKFDAPVFAGTTNEVALIRTNVGKLWRSSAPGTWSDLLLSGVGGLLVGENNSNRVLVYQENTNVYWTSTDAAGNLIKHQDDRYWFEDSQLGYSAQLEMHPLDSDSVLGITYTSGCRANRPGTDAWLSSCVPEISTSSDFGSTWSTGGSWSQKASWGWAGVYGVPKTNFYYLYGQTQSWTNYYNYFYYIGSPTPLIKADTVQGSGSGVELTSNSADFLFLRHWLFTLDYPENYEETGALELRIGSGGCIPVVATLPIQLSAQGTIVHILDATYISLILGAIVVTNSLEYGDVMLSDEIGTSYTTILERVAITGSSWSDYEFQWHRVKGLSTVFIANVAIDTGGANVRTKITYDMGSNWHYLTPPSGSSCTGECFLNLMIDSNGGIYSFAEYPGLIVALGNVGSQLSPSSTVNVVISTDAGLTWTMTSLTGHYRAEWAGALVLVPVSQGSILYSTDEGSTFNQFSGGNGDVKGVSEITAHPTTTRMLAEVTTTTGTTRLLDIQIGSLAPACTESDYHMWSPVDPNGKCVKDHIPRYNRKIPHHSCIDNGSYRSVSLCNCDLTECTDKFDTPVPTTCGGTPSSSDSDSSSSFNALYVVIPLVVVLVLGGAGAGGFFYWKKRQAGTKTSKPDWDRLEELDTEQ